MSDRAMPLSRKEARARGEKFYLGRICKNGNVAMRHVERKTCTCEPCKSQRSNSEALKKGAERWRAKNKEAELARKRDGRKKDPIKVREYYRNYAAARKNLIRDRRYAEVYRMQPGEYDVFNDHQKGRCAICGQEPTEGKRLQVDHCHQTGRIRGLLCNGCNVAVGFMEKHRAEVPSMLNYADHADIRSAIRVMQGQP